MHPLCYIPSMPNTELHLTKSFFPSMSESSDIKSYDYMGVQALPPRKKGRDRRRLNKALNIQEEEEVKEDMEVTASSQVIDDPLSPFVEE